MPALSSHPLPHDEALPARAPATEAPRQSGLHPRGSHSEPARRPVVLGHRYALERYLDRGGTAIVYLAHDMQTDCKVVVKILNRNASSNPELRRHFLTGSRAAQAVVHPNVVRVLSVVEPGSSAPYMVMEALRGELLADVLGRGVELSEHAALCVARQTALGLSALHEAGIVHCDVKPENLFVVGALTAPESLKILDFGLAAVRGVEVADTQFVRGTAQYMAPEQVLGDPVDGRTDVYALGVVLFRMLTGHLPFDLKLCATLLRHQLWSPAPPPSWLNEKLSPAVEALVLRALSKQPDNRQPSAVALALEIEAALSGALASLAAPGPSADVYVPSSPRGEHSARILGKHV